MIFFFGGAQMTPSFMYLEFIIQKKKEKKEEKKMILKQWYES